MPDANRPPALPAQQPVTPPETPGKLPSLALYAVLSGLSVLLIVAGFFATSDKLSGLLMNLATELLGAVIILILVERRLEAERWRPRRLMRERPALPPRVGTQEHSTFCHQGGGAGRRHISGGTPALR